MDVVKGPTSFAELIEPFLAGVPWAAHSGLGPTLGRSTESRRNPSLAVRGSSRNTDEPQTE